MLTNQRTFIAKEHPGNIFFGLLLEHLLISDLNPIDQSPSSTPLVILARCCRHLGGFSAWAPEADA